MLFWMESKMIIQLETRGRTLQEMQIFSSINGKVRHPGEIALMIAELEKIKKKLVELYEEKANISISLEDKK